MHSRVEFQVLVGLHIQARERFAEADVEGLYGFGLPMLAASEEEIVGVERCLGCELPEDYRTFLLCCSGWPWFVQDIDLYGVTELAERQAQLSDLHPDALVEAGLELARDRPIVVGGAREDRDAIVLSTSGTEQGRVVWFSGAVVESFGKFSEALATFTNLTREATDELLAETGR